MASPLTIADPPHSGLGDRFAAWLSLFTLAELRKSQALLPPTQWNHSTHGWQARQSEDLRSALSCLLLPAHVRVSSSVDAHAESIAYLSGPRAYFGRGVVTPYGAPGFPQWAIPELAATAFARMDPSLRNLTVPDYLSAMRDVGRRVGIRRRCVPAGATAHGFAVHPTEPDAEEEEEEEEGQEEEEEATGSLPSQLRPRIRVALHLRRGDTWGIEAREHATAAASRSTKFLRGINGSRRAHLTTATGRSLAVIIEALDSHKSKQPGMQPASWLVLSDDPAEAAAYAHLIRNVSSTGQAAYVPPPGFAAFSFLAMRHVDGIVQSATRQWSSFSSVPAVMGDVPILAIDGGAWGAVPHARVCSTVEQYVHGDCGGPCQSAWLGNESSFVARLLRGRRSCKDPPPVRLRQAANQGALSHEAWRWLSAPQNQPRPGGAQSQRPGPPPSLLSAPASTQSKPSNRTNEQPASIDMPGSWEQRSTHT